MSKVYTQKFNKNIWITDGVKDELFYIIFILYCQHWRHLMLTSRITEGEKRNFKTNTDNHNGDLHIVFFYVLIILNG